MVSGRTSTRGSARSMKWTAVELLDTAARREVDGVRGYGEGVAAMASAMAGERERERLGENGCVLRVHGAAWSSSILPACLAGKQLAGAALGWAGRWAGCWAPGKVFYFFSVFCFFNTSATLLN